MHFMMHMQQLSQELLRPEEILHWKTPQLLQNSEEELMNCRSRSIRHHAGRSAGVAQRVAHDRDRQNSAEAQNDPSSGRRHAISERGG